MLALACLVPAKALVLASAHMRDRIHKSAIHQGQAIRVEASRYGYAVAAIPIQQAGCRAVELRFPVIQQRHRHALAVFGRRMDTARDIGLGIMAGRHFLHFQQRAFTRLHIVVEQFRRRCHRRIAEADDIGVEFHRSGKAQRIGLLIEGDRVLLAVRGPPDDNARKSVFALHPDKMAFEYAVTEKKPARLVRNDVGPFLLAR